MRIAFLEMLLSGGMAEQRAVELSTIVLAMMEGGILLSRTYHTGDPLRRSGVALAILIDAV